MKRIINGIELEVSETLEEFSIEQKPSSSVEYFGNRSSDVFVQFKNGGTYIYNDVPDTIIEQMRTTDSIGACVSRFGALGFKFEKFKERMVKRFPVTQK